jgi:8-amino-7-oxononanoate synthase
MTTVLEKRIRERLQELRRAGLHRTLSAPCGIDLSSNDYLGFAADPYLKRRMCEAVAREGCGSTGSRLLRGQRTSFSAVEKRFAAFKGTEAALYFATGYAANLAVLSAFASAGDVFVSDRANHASIRDGIRLSAADKVVVPHNDPRAVRQALDSSTTSGQRFLVTESVFSMDGDVAPLAEYAEICRKGGAALIVDEAHAVGIYGRRGTGCIEAAGIESDVFLSINTAGKALGVCGAFVAGPAWAIDYLIQRARPFVFSTAPPPPVAAALDAALDLVEREPERRDRVLSLAKALRELLADRGVAVAQEETQIIPVLLYDTARAVAVASALQHDGFDVRAIRPPTVPTGSARLRISLNVSLNEEILFRFADSLAGAMRSFPA